jgi:hypothetical protein
VNLWRHLTSGLDPVRTAKQLGMRCDPWQVKALRSSAPRLLLNCHRQAGKTTVAAVSAVHAALYQPGSLTLVVSPTQRQSTELFRVALNFYRQLGKPVDSESENALSLTLENSSRIVSIPGSETNIRGYSANLVIVDEAARVPDDVYEAISPMVAVTGGRLLVMSTPAGRRGWFYEAATSERWETLTVKATECPRISAGFLEEELATLGTAVFEQEYLCIFSDAAGAAFNSDDVDAIFGGAAPVRQAAPAAPRRLTESEQTALEIRRTVRTLNGRIDRRRQDEARRQRLCTHRWRVSEAGRQCVFCELYEPKEEGTCSA